MPFNSYEFMLAYLPATFAGFWMLRRLGVGVSLWWLILASLCFYALGSPTGLIIIGAEILINYLIATALIRLNHSQAHLAQLIFAAGVVANILFLSYFKYWSFLAEAVLGLDTVQIHARSERIIIPLGISFLTFQQLGFLAEVRAGQIQSLNLRGYLMFALFFPRALAGPIVRYNEVIEQLPQVGSRDVGADVAVGTCLFSIGLFKKTIIADGIAQYVPMGFDSAAAGGAPPTMFVAWIGVLAYTFQLYFDFSGYSDMALGSARLFGIRLPMNFNAPLKASSIIDFWARWHISLTRFLTDYVYNPVVLSLTRDRLRRGRLVLRGKRSSLRAVLVLVAFPTLLTMAISGIWHGVGWQYLAWGLLHGLYLTVNQSWRIFRGRFWPDQVSYERIMTPMGFIITFSAVVVAMVFFRAASLSSAFSIVSAMIGLNGVIPESYAQLGFSLSAYLTTLVVPSCWIIVLFVAVVFLPNSLEILRRFDPALDFQSEVTAPGSEVVETRSLAATTNQRAVVMKETGRLGRVLSGRAGVTLSRGTAVLMAAAFVLGTVAMRGSTSFLYFRF